MERETERERESWREKKKKKKLKRTEKRAYSSTKSRNYGFRDVSQFAGQKFATLLRRGERGGERDVPERREREKRG